MRNNTEVSLSNRSFPDITAWRAVRNAGKSGMPVTIYQPEIPKITQSQTTRITELNRQLSVLRQQKKRGEIAPSYYRIRQKELAIELHAEMERTGHKPIRTKKPHR